MQRVRKIVLIDDDLDDREIFIAACQAVDPGVEIDVREDGEEAVQQLSSSAAAPAIIFLDLNMPRFNGVEILRELRRSRHLDDTSIIVYTTSFDQRLRETCLSLGASAIVEKPNSFESLCSLVESVLHLRS